MHSHALIFIQDLAIVLLVAGLITVLCRRLKQPVVLGYIIAGMIVGPYTPPFSLIRDELTIKTLAELGVIFLMFFLGLEFNIRKLIKVGIPSLIAAVAEIALMIWLGYEIGIWFGWQTIDAIFLGAMLAISSTTIIVKALDELGMKRERFAQLIFGILVIEDIFAIAMLGLLSSIAMSGSLHFSEVMISLGKLSSFLVVSLFFGILFIPKLLNYIAKFNNNETLLITVLAICFGFCLFVIKLNYSIALGAFVIGAVMAESRHLRLIEDLVNPLKDMFSAIFFVSVGLLLDPRVLWDYALPIFVITLIVIFGKILTGSLGTLISGQDGKTSMRVGMGLAQIGEFSFIIAALGTTLKVTSDFLYPIAVAVSAITTLLTPYLIKYSDPTTHFISKIIPRGLANTFSLYGGWLQNIQLDENQSPLKKIVRNSIIQIVINLFIIMAIFFGSNYAANTMWGVYLLKLTSIDLQETIIWGFALLLSLPFLIAIYRKITALSMLLAELSLKKSANKRLTLRVRRVISQLIPILSLIGILFFISILSASILPPFELILVIFCLAAILIALLLPWFIKFHSRLQISLMETMKKDGE